MFQIKICGVTNADDALMALEAGADAIGLNFYGKSRRHVDVTTAAAITDAIYSAAGDRFHGLVYPVGVFVNHSAAIVNRIYHEARLVIAQLHGDEPPEFFGLLPNLSAIRVRRISGDNYASLGDDFRACRDAVVAAGSEFENPCAVLVDAPADQYGGTGETISWPALADHRRWLGETPLILAGGLTPENVAEAIRIVRPHAVDVASGVELSPGKKDPCKVRDFVAAAREAFERLH